MSLKWLDRLPGARRPADKARRGSIPAVCDRGATPSDGMPRPGSVKVIEGHTTRSRLAALFFEQCLELGQGCKAPRPSGAPRILGERDSRAPARRVRFFRHARRRYPGRPWSAASRGRCRRIPDQHVPHLSRPEPADQSFEVGHEDCRRRPASWSASAKRSAAVMLRRRSSSGSSCRVRACST